MFNNEKNIYVQAVMEMMLISNIMVSCEHEPEREYLQFADSLATKMNQGPSRNYSRLYFLFPAAVLMYWGIGVLKTL